MYIYIYIERERKIIKQRWILLCCRVLLLVMFVCVSLPAGSSTSIITRVSITSGSTSVIDPC